MRPRRSPLVFTLALAYCACAAGGLARAQKKPADRGNPMKLESAAFTQMGSIPTKYTCEGDDIAPPLAWHDLPEGTKSLALIVDDPDAPDPKAPKVTWVHWVLFNLSPLATGLTEGKALPAGAIEGINDWKKTKYGGPCPPIGRHRYFHKLYALDTLLTLKQATKSELEAAMQGHILARAELVGTYEKRKQ